MRVTVVNSSRVQVVTASRGLRGPIGPAGSGEGYVHEQAMPSALWTVVHNLNKYPTVIITDEDMNTIDGLVQYIDIDTLTVAFNSLTAGKAVLN